MPGKSNRLPTSCSKSSFMGTQSRPILYVLPKAAYSLQWPSCIVVTEAIWPLKPKILILWAFLEKVCWHLFYMTGEESQYFLLAPKYFFFHLTEKQRFVLLRSSLVVVGVGERVDGYRDWTREGQRTGRRRQVWASGSSAQTHPTHVLPVSPAKSSFLK